MRAGEIVGAITLTRVDAATVSPQPGRARRNLRRSGRHRHRERPPVRGRADAHEGTAREPSNTRPRPPMSSGHLALADRAATGARRAREIAATLCAADMALIYHSDEEFPHSRRPRVSIQACALHERSIRRGPARHRLVGRAVLDRRAEHVPDMLADPEYRSPGCARDRSAIRAVLAVPLLREGNRRLLRADAHDAGALHRAPDRAGRDLRRPSRDRHREHPTVRGRADADQRASGIPHAANGDIRGARRHLEVASRPAAGARCTRRLGVRAVRRADGVALRPAGRRSAGPRAPRIFQGDDGGAGAAPADLRARFAGRARDRHARQRSHPRCHGRRRIHLARLRPRHRLAQHAGRALDARQASRSDCYPFIARSRSPLPNARSS